MASSRLEMVLIMNQWEKAGSIGFLIGTGIVCNVTGASHLTLSVLGLLTQRLFVTGMTSDQAAKLIVSPVLDKMPLLPAPNWALLHESSHNDHSPKLQMESAINLDNWYDIQKMLTTSTSSN